MASISSVSAWLISMIRTWVAIPRKSTTGSSTSATVAARGPRPVELATSASATIAADSAPRKIVVRLYASFHSSDRCPIRLQCSVAKIATASGPSGWSLTGVGTAAPRSAAGAAASPAAGGLPVLSVAPIPLLGRAVRVAEHVHSMKETAAKTADMTAEHATTHARTGRRLPGPAIPAYSVRRPSGGCVGQGDHAVAALGDRDQAQVRALAGTEQRGPAAHHDRDDDEAQLVDQAVLEQRLGELAVAIDHQVPVPLLLEFGHGGDRIARDDR